LVGNSESVKLVVAALYVLNQPGIGFYMSDFLIKLNQVFPKSDFHTVIRNPKALKNENLDEILKLWGYDFNRREILAFPIYEMISTIIEIFGLQKLNDNRLASWMDYVFNLSQKTGFGLYDLLDDWKIQTSKLSIQIPEDVDAVNVLTIHKSKGLDWPVVIVAQGNWGRKHKKHSFWVELPKESALPVMILPSSKKVQESIFEKEFDEETGRIEVDNFNAMYVAFTRPAERLYVMTIKPDSDFFSDVFATLLELEGNEKVKVTYEEVKGKNVMKSFAYGHEKRLPPEEELEGNPFDLVHLQNNKNSLYRDKLKVKKNYLKWMNDSGERDYGNLVHKAFSFIPDLTDVNQSVEKLVALGDLGLDEVSPMKSVISDVINHPQLASYFEKGLIVKNEEDIVLPNGDFLRPDRVVIRGNDACVIDFKTGMRKPEHDQQITSYRLQLEQMGYENVKSLLVYTTKLEVVEV
jgi:hypothetical protein